MLTVRKRFDEWAEKYDEYLPHFPVYRKIIDIILENANIAERAKILDVGIGTGNASLSVFSKTPCRITGVDISEEMMEIAREKAVELGAELELVSSSADEMELNDTFDFAVAAFSIHHLDEARKLEAFRRMHKSLKENGRFILADVTVIVDGDIKSEERLKHIFERWSYEALYALKYIGPEAVDTALKGLRGVIYRDGEYPETPEKWKSLIEEAGFKIIRHETPDEKIGYQVFVCEKV